MKSAAPRPSPHRPARRRDLRVATFAALLVLAVALGACASRTQLHRDGALEVVTLRVAHNNAHVVRGPRGALLVDAGLPKDAAALEDRMRAAGVDPQSLRAIVVTHAHADHVGGAAYFRAKYGTTIVAGAGDRAMLASGRHEPLCPTDFLARQRCTEDQGQTFAPLQADVWVEPAATLDLEPLTGVAARAIALPGHTAGSLVVVAGRVALVGDLFRGSIPGWSATRHFYLCDLRDNQRDLRALLDDLAPAATTFFPGHFGPVERASLRALAEEPVALAAEASPGCPPG